MPDIKEKLVGLIGKAKELYANDYTDHTEDDYIAETLLDNGVTIQEWISVEERLPERTMPPHDVLVYHDLGIGRFVDRAWYSYEKNKWRSFRGMNLKVTHWMPLPQPPKGE